MSLGSDLASAAGDPEHPVYPTWIRSRRTLVFWLVAVAILLLGTVTAVVWLPGLAFALLAIPFFYIAVVLSLTSYRLGPRGGDFQNRIHRLLIDSVGNEGRLLDVGCGSGQLLIRFAKSAPGEYVGLDYWGDDWEYSQAQAERNAELERVQGLQFLHGSASRLPFADGEFGRVVSSLTFHEVQDVEDRTVSVAEALRVLDSGGRFGFVDLFDDPRLYDGLSHVLRVIASAGGKVECSRRLSNIFELRFPLNLAKVLKYAVLVSGSKSLVAEGSVQDRRGRQSSVVGSAQSGQVASPVAAAAPERSRTSSG
jgi:SAM-dependent methyltransferase